MEISLLSITILLTVSYLIGSLNAAKILTNLLKKGQDISLIGTKNAGAWNAWMHFGKTYGLLVFGVDAAKGALVVAGSRMYGFTETEMFSAMAATIIGHNWPIFFRFKGGKGFATLIGSVLTFNPAGALGAYALTILFILMRFSGIAPLILLGTFVFLQQKNTGFDLIFISCGIILAGVFLAKRIQADWQDLKIAPSKLTVLINLLLFDRVEKRKVPSLLQVLFRKKDTI